jgi:hypothetical protein
MRAICRRNLWVPSVLVLALLGASFAFSAPASAAAPDLYANMANWICRPERDDPCDRNLNATVVEANGRMTVEQWAPAPNAPVDCFYVYPTSSLDLGSTSDRNPGVYEEIYATRTQAARFGSKCRMYVPVYRSITTTWLITGYLTATLSEFPDDLVNTAYGDVVAAFRHYLSVDNGGRGFVLLGHSQGSELLARLIAEEIAPNASARARLVSAALIGLPAESHPSPDVLPACSVAGQIGCHLTYASFRATSPPAQGSGFARSVHPEDCTNPAALAGGPATLRSYFPTSGYRWQSTGRLITTPFVTLPGLVSGQCVTSNGYTFLAITVNANPADPRTDNVPGDMVAADLNGEWGLHTSDVQLALGDLVDVVGQQIATYQARR